MLCSHVLRKGTRLRGGKNSCNNRLCTVEKRDSFLSVCFEFTFIISLLPSPCHHLFSRLWSGNGLNQSFWPLVWLVFYFFKPVRATLDGTWWSRCYKWVGFHWSCLLIGRIKSSMLQSSGQASLASEQNWHHRQWLAPEESCALAASEWNHYKPSVSVWIRSLSPLEIHH